MKTPHPCGIWPTCVLLFLLSVLNLFGQVSPDASSVPTPASETDQPGPVKLDPFQVNVSRDVGFVGASALAGGRLSGDLKDTPVAYSVLTKEFIDALNLTNFTDASVWLVNSNTSTQNGITDLYSGVNVNFRGVSLGATLRNYFRFGLNFDSYNVDRFDMARGPNAIVFGTGSVSGSATVITKVATPGHDAEELKTSYGTFGTIRTTADVNASPNDNVAVRANVLYQYGGGQREPEQFEFRRAATLAATWNITPTLQLRGEAEGGLIERNTPLFGFWDHFSGWDGKTVFAGPNSTPPSNSNLTGVQRWGSATAPEIVYAPSLNRNSVLDLTNTYTTQGGNQTTATPLGGSLVTGTVIQASGYVTLPADAALDLPANRFDLAEAGSHFRIPSANWAAGIDGPTWYQPYQNYTLTLSKQYGNLYLTASGFYGYEHRKNTYIAGNAFQNTYIDLDQTLPSGAVNPEYLEPYNQNVETKYDMETQSRSFRLESAYLLTNTRWGDYSFNVQGGMDEGIQINHYLYDAAEINSDAALWPSANMVNFRYYWDQTSRPVLSGSSVSYNGVTYPTALVAATQSPSNLTHQETRDPYAFAALKARWFNGRVHLLAAGRHDDYLSQTSQSVAQGVYPTNWNGQQVIYAPAAPANWSTLTYVPKDANGNPTGPATPADTRPINTTTLAPLPQYANDQFRNDYSPPDIRVGNTTYSVGTVVYIFPDWLSVFYNYATSFNPNSAVLTIDGQPFTPQTSFGDDAGVRFNLSSRWSIAVEKYRGVNTNEAWDPGTALDNALNAIINAVPAGSASTNGMNTRGLIDVPNHFYESRQHQTDGYEFELVGNPLPGLRTLFNASITNAYQTNAYQHFLAYYAQNGATLRQIVLDSGATISSANVASSTLTAAQAPSAASAAAAYNTIQTTYIANAVSGSQVVTRDVKNSGNVFVDYELQNGWLKRLRFGVGANYRGPEVIGYTGANTIANPASPSVAIPDPAASPYTPVYGHAYTVATAMASYKFRLTRRDQIELALNVGNVLNYNKAIYYDTLMRPPGGDLTTPARVAVPGDYYFTMPRTYTFTVTWKR